MNRYQIQISNEMLKNQFGGLKGFTKPRIITSNMRFVLLQRTSKITNNDKQVTFWRVQNALSQPVPQVLPWYSMPFGIS